MRPCERKPWTERCSSGTAAALSPRWMSAKPRSLSCLGSPEAAAVVDRVDAVLAVRVLAVLAVLAVAERAARVLVVWGRLALEVPWLALVVVAEPAPPLRPPPPVSAIAAT